MKTLERIIARARIVVLLLVFVCVATGTAIADRMRSAPTPAPGAATAANAPTGRLTQPAGATPAPTEAPSPAAGLKAYPPLPPPPPGNGPIRRRKGATGTTISVSTDATTCSTTIGVNYNLNCKITLSYTQGPASSGTLSLVYLAPNAGNAPVALGGSTITLSATGVWVFAVYNSTTSAYDEIVYLNVGSAPSVQTYDSSNNLTQVFTANGSNTVVIKMTGATTGDYYVMTAERTSLASGASGKNVCAWTSGTGSTSTGTNFCNPATITSANAIQALSSTISGTWQPAATENGTYSISVYDVGTASGSVSRVAQIQVTLTGTNVTYNTTSGLTAPSWTLSTTASTAGTRSDRSFAFYSQTEASAGGASVTDVYGNIACPMQLTTDSFLATIQDPTGSVISTNGGNQAYGAQVCTGATFLPSWVDFQIRNWYAQPKIWSYSGYKNATWTMTLFDTTKKQLVSASSFRILGFSSSISWVNAASTVLALPSGTLTTNDQMQFTNDGDIQYGTGNSDNIIQYVATTLGTNEYQSITFNTSACPGTTTCTATDTVGNTWTFTINGSSGNSTWSVTATANNQAFGLPPNAIVKTPLMSINLKNGNHCTGSGCNWGTQLKPLHGTGNLSQDQNVANQIYVINGSRQADQASGNFSLYGYVSSAGGAVTTSGDAYRYTTRNTRGFYTGSNLSLASSGYYDVFKLAVNNLTSSTANIQFVQVQLPAGFDATKVISASSMSGLTSPSTWTAQVCSQAPSVNFVCFQANPGITPGSSQNIYFAVPPPTQSFTYTDIAGGVTTSTTYTSTTAEPLQNDGSSTTVFVGSNPTTVDSLAVASYAFDPTLMTALFTPSSVGQSLTPANVTLSVQNASLSLASFPDYIDAIVLETSATGITLASASAPTGWNLSGTTTLGNGTPQYWFQLCGNTPNASYGPNATSAGINYPSCASATEAASLGPGQQVQLPLTINTGTSNINANVYVHGANGGGWSKAIPITLTVSSLSATGGFINAGTYGNPPAVSTGQQPQVGTATSGNGNSFVYEIKNTGGTGASAIANFAIKIPGTDTSGANATNAGTYWNLTNTTSITLKDPASGTVNPFGCTLGTGAQAPTSATTAGGNGFIYVSGCNITGGKAVDVTFSSTTPSTQNDSYRFTSAVNLTTAPTAASPAGAGGTSSAENWLGGQTVLLQNATSLAVYIPPQYSGLSPTRTGSGTASCTTCTYSTSPIDQITFGTVNPGTNVSGNDIILVRLQNANASAPYGWKLYASSTYNATITTSGSSGTGSELQAAFDLTGSTTGLSMNATQGNGTYASILTTTPGTQLVDTGTTPGAVGPYDMYFNFKIGIGTETPTGTSATLTFTWISN